MRKKIHSLTVCSDAVTELLNELAKRRVEHPVNRSMQGACGGREQHARSLPHDAAGQGKVPGGGNMGGGHVRGRVGSYMGGGPCARQGLVQGRTQVGLVPGGQRLVSSVLGASLEAHRVGV